MSNVMLICPSCGQPTRMGSARGRVRGSASARSARTRSTSTSRSRWLLARCEEAQGRKSCAENPDDEGRARDDGSAAQREVHRHEVVPALHEQLGYANVNEVPRLEKIVVNMGVGAAVADTKQLDAAIEDLRIITGQQPTITRAKKSIAGFKIREGMPIGAKVTLRGDRMWEFFDRLVGAAIPRIRDFRGLPSKQFRRSRQLLDGRHRAADLPRDRLRQGRSVRGMDITFVTTAKTDEEAKALLEAFGFPFKR